MNLKKILMLDDGNINQTIEGIRTKLRRSGIDIAVDKIDPQDTRFKSYVGGEQVIDFDKIKLEITENYRNTRYDIVACDFSFSSETLNGYELIRWIINDSRSRNFRFKNAKFVCYSGEEHKFREHIFNNNELVKLIRLNIHAFFKRDNLVDELSSLVKKISDSYSATDYFRSLLEQEPDKEFKNIYPQFEGKKLGEIACEIERNSHHGIEFQKYMADLTYAHILDLNE
ncbi:hypothetical protein [Vibrio cyclitrophicus]|uniref:Uncharacterized protein n=1 Tax=Vibrio cyclitrophicus ZF270 TaxID=1136176 RepID=A0AAN0LLQ2_9VIBR|nr:hypothetical protein [Vibrio cyclitrophicus]OEE04196.1 hypothetical protein OC7_10120 [Vibrio cyclitrophicus ZF270]